MLQNFKIDSQNGSHLQTYVMIYVNNFVIRGDVKEIEDTMIMWILFLIVE